MSVEHRIESLRSRHAARDAALRREECRPCPDVGRVSQLKRDKLWLKDEILRLSQGAGQGAVSA